MKDDPNAEAKTPSQHNAPNSKSATPDGTGPGLGQQAEHAADKDSDVKNSEKVLKEKKENERKDADNDNTQDQASDAESNSPDPTKAFSAKPGIPLIIL